MRSNLQQKAWGVFSFMPIAAYPTSATLYRPFEQELEPDYAVTASPAFADGGRDFNLDADQTIRRWRIRYTGLSEAEAASIRTHAAAAKYSSDFGSAYGFDFTPRGGSVIANVRYDRGGFTLTHTKTWIWSVEVLLVKYP